MYMNTSYRYHSISDTKSRVITKVHDLLGQPSYLCCCYCCPHGHAFFSKLIIIKLFIILDWNLRWVAENHKDNMLTKQVICHNQMIQPIQSTKRKMKPFQTKYTKQGESIAENPLYFPKPILSIGLGLK